MAKDEGKDPMLEGVGNPAREKTLAEHPVSDRDIEEIHDDIADLQDDLADLKSQSDEIV